VTYDELILEISRLNGKANKLCENLADTKHTLNPQEKANKVKEILAIWKKADELLPRLSDG
jgi:hypothetical protein